jgi:hypothetical protein
MNDVNTILSLLGECTPAQREEVFRELRKNIALHPLEGEFNARAEVILEAIQRGGPLMRRMIRGVIAQASFEVEVLEKLPGFETIPCEGNPPFDFRIRDTVGDVRLQVKLQRSKAGVPMHAREAGRRFLPGFFVVETQKTRRGTKGERASTRPYRFGEFDVLVVSLYPSSQRWDAFMYTVANWLLPSPAGKKEICKFQPVPAEPDEYWTNDLATVIDWFRSGETKKIPRVRKGK